MSFQRMKMLIRADAGPRVGTGHVMRTLALGQAWKRMGGEVAFACGDLPNALIARIQKQDFDVYKLDHWQCDVADAEETAEIADSFQPNWLVLDGYQFDDPFQRVIRDANQRYGNGFRTMVMDDYCHADHTLADMVVNQNVYAKRELYLNVNFPSSTKPRILTGPRFALLRQEFQKDQFANTKCITKAAKRVLVTFGGADADNWTLKSLESLSQLNRKRLIVDCVIGACYTHQRELERFKKTANLSLRIHRNVEHMSILMERADLAISAGGSTCYELARCGVPTIAIPIAENQVAVANEMHAQGVMICPDDFSKRSPAQFAFDETRKSPAVRPSFDQVEPVSKTDQHVSKNDACDSDDRKHPALTSTIQKLLTDFAKRKRMSSRGMELVDGQGGDRIAQQMASMMYSFRVAQRGDADLMLGWRNDPEVRSVSFCNDSIALDAHQNWLERQLVDPHTTIWISEDEGGNPVGQIRLETSPDGSTAVVSIIVDQSRRGRGIGKIMIAHAAETFFGITEVMQIVAQIKPGNAASEKAFRSAGFEPIEPTIVNGKLANQFALNREVDSQQLAVQKSA